jgi:hypothetical protein
MSIQRRDSAVYDFWDILIPGGAAWPSASAALGHISPEALDLPEEDSQWLRQQSEALVRTPAALRHARMIDLERSGPECFARVLAALYAAYYTSSPVQAAVRRLANASPGEESPQFDRTLVQRVLATKAHLRGE